MSFAFGSEYSTWMDVSLVLGVIAGLLALVFWIFQFKLFKFFSQFEGDFEKNFSKGFLVLFSVAILSFIFERIGFFGSLYYAGKYGPSFQTESIFVILYPSFSALIIGIISVYGIYLMYKGTKYYKKS